jgi:hypothetical protein
VLCPREFLEVQSCPIWSPSLTGESAGESIRAPWPELSNQLVGARQTPRPHTTIWSVATATCWRSRARGRAPARLRTHVIEATRARQGLRR